MMVLRCCSHLQIFSKYIWVFTISIVISGNVIVADTLDSSQQETINDKITKGSNNLLMYSIISEVCTLLSMDSEIIKMEFFCNDVQLINSILSDINATITYDERFLCERTISKFLKNEKMPTRQIYYLRNHNIIESIVDLMSYWKRFKGAFFYDDYSGIEENTQRYLRLRAIDAEMIHISSKNNISNDLLSAIRNHDNMIILCDDYFTDAIFKKVKLLNLFSGNYTWIIVGNNVPEVLVSVDIAPNAQVTLMSPRIVKGQTSNTLAKSPYSTENRSLINLWLEKHGFCTLFDTNKKLEILINRKDKIPANLKYAPDIDVLDVFFSLASNATETVKFAHWNQISKLFMLEKLDKRDKKRRLKGRRIRMAVFQHKPYTFFTRINGTLHVSGYLREMFDMIIETLNIRYSFRETDEQFGTNENGTFTGFAGRLYRREVEMGMNVLAMTPSRRLGVRYVGPVTKAYFAIVYNRPNPIIPPTTYLLPFTLLVWIFIFFALALVVAAIFLVMTVSPFSREYITQSEKVHTRPFRLITFTYLEEVFEYPPGLPSKVVYGTLLLAVLAIFAHYTSIFTSFLAYQEEKIPFETLDDVAMNLDYQVLIVNKTRHHDVFQNAKDGAYAMVWKRILKQGAKSFEYSFESGFNEMKTGMYSYISDGPTCTFLSGGNCSIAFGPITYYHEYYNMAHRRDFPYTRMFSINLMQIMESGIFRRLTVFYNLDSRTPCNLGGNTLSFGINQVVGVFFVYGCGILISFLVFVLERYMPQRYQQKAMQQIIKPKVGSQKMYYTSAY